VSCVSSRLVNHKTITRQEKKRQPTRTEELKPDFTRNNLGGPFQRIAEEIQVTLLTNENPSLLWCLSWFLQLCICSLFGVSSSCASMQVQQQGTDVNLPPPSTCSNRHSPSTIMARRFLSCRNLYLPLSCLWSVLVFVSSCLILLSLV
jgi:hypothetical protein